MKTKQSLIPFGINAPLICIEWVLISQLKLNARNARVHPDAQIVMLARSIDTFGITKPIIIDELNRVLCGNAIVQAAERLGMTSVPAVRLTHLTKEQKRALAIADNKLAEKSVWDFDVLKTELLSIIDVEPDFDLFAIGFETPELDIILDVADEHDDALPELAPDQFVAQPGDLFRLGNYCVYCGDARDTQSYDAALGTERARLVVTDPPYNVRIDGHAGGSGAVKHAEFVMASGEMGDGEFKTLTAHCTTSSWTGATLSTCWHRPMGSIRSSKTSAFGAKPTPEWVPFIAHSMSSASFSSMAPHRTSTTSISARTGAIAETCGTTLASTALAAGATSCSPCTQRSSHWRSSPTLSRTRPSAAISSSTHLVALARR